MACVRSWGIVSAVRWRLALKDLGVKTQLVVYPNEGHGFVNAEHRRDVLERALGWFEEYMP